MRGEPFEPSRAGCGDYAGSGLGHCNQPPAWYGLAYFPHHRKLCRAFACDEHRHLLDVGPPLDDEARAEGAALGLSCLEQSDTLECHSVRRDGKSVIVEAALASVKERGWEATSMQAVRERAGVSNGALFHHFPTRADLAAAVVVAGLADHQAVMLLALRAAEGAEDGVRRAVVRHLRWIEDNPQLARLFLFSPPELLQTMLDEAALDAKRGFTAEVGDWLRTHGWPGTPELAAVVALWIGPTHEYARGRLASPAASLTPIADTLAAGAWRAVQPLLGGAT